MELLKQSVQFRPSGLANPEHSQYSPLVLEEVVLGFSALGLVWVLCLKLIISRRIRLVLVSSPIKVIHSGARPRRYAIYNGRTAMGF